MSRKLHIAEKFSLPLDLVTMTQAILARKRSGKSYTASVQAEEMLEAGQQIAVIDPTGAWWGLRASADGKSAGYPIVVFGGAHADAPLDYRGGTAMATAFIEHGFSAIFDLKKFKLKEQLQFVIDFCAELLRINDRALHVFMDEADTFAPQTPKSQLANESLDTVSRLVKQGGLGGTGFTMITQRSASINWDILSQIDLLTILRMSAPHDVNPVFKWLQSETSLEFAAEVKAALPGLPVGTAFVASAPLSIAQRIQVRTRRTFNSGATPKPGERKFEPKVLATIDIAKLGQSIADSVKKAQETSPEALQRRVAELERQLVTAKSAAPVQQVQAGMTAEERKAVEMLKEKLDTLSEEIGKVEAREAALADQIAGAREICQRLMDALWMDNPEVATPKLRDAEREARQMLPKLVAQNAAPKPVSLISHALPRPAAAATGEKVGKALKSILTVLAQYGACTRSKLAALANYSAKGGGFQNSLSEGRTKGWLSGSDPLEITPEGLAALGQYDPLPRGAELMELTIAKLGKAEREIVKTLAQYTSPLSRQELADACGYAASGGGFQNALSNLRTRELLQGRDRIQLAPDFADAIAE